MSRRLETLATVKQVAVANERREGQRLADCLQRVGDRNGKLDALRRYFCEYSLALDTKARHGVTVAEMQQQRAFLFSSIRRWVSSIPRSKLRSANSTNNARVGSPLNARLMRSRNCSRASTRKIRRARQNASKPCRTTSPANNGIAAVRFTAGGAQQITVGTLG